MKESGEEADKGLGKERTKGLALFHGFLVFTESLTNSRRQLESIARLTPVQKQFVATLADTETATGYFLKTGKLITRPSWVAYLAVKMKYRGDVAYLAELISHQPPSRSLNKNTLTKNLDLRWSVQVQGVVAYALLLRIQPYLRNEKKIIEVACVIKHGPSVPSHLPHPFETCGAARVRRGVWFWPQIDGPENATNIPTVDK